MKRFTLVILIIISCIFAPTVVVSESRVLVRAVAQQDTYNELSDYLMPGFLARARIKIYGLRRCSAVLEGSDKPYNLVNFLATIHGENTHYNNHNNNTHNKARIKHYLSRLKNNGCSFDSVDLGGLPAVHGSILYNDYGLVVFLIENGANIQNKIHRPGKKSHDKNALAFAYLMREVEPNVNRDQIIEYLKNKK